MPPQDRAFAVEEIVVRARRRFEPLEDTPIALSVLGADRLEEDPEGGAVTGDRLGAGLDVDDPVAAAAGLATVGGLMTTWKCWAPKRTLRWG